MFMPAEKQMAPIFILLNEDVIRLEMVDSLGKFMKMKVSRTEAPM